MPKPFGETMRLFRQGQFNDECAELFAQMVRGVEETGKAGKLTITIDVKKAGAAVQVAAKVTDKTPEPTPDADLFWTTVEGNLTHSNPNQQQLDLKPVDGTERRVVAG